VAAAIHPYTWLADVFVATRSHSHTRAGGCVCGSVWLVDVFVAGGCIHIATNKSTSHTLPQTHPAHVAALVHVFVVGASHGIQTLPQTHPLATNTSTSHKHIHQPHTLPQTHPAHVAASVHVFVAAAVVYGGSHKHMNRRSHVSCMCFS